MNRHVSAFYKKEKEMAKPKAKYSNEVQCCTAHWNHFSCGYYCHKSNISEYIHIFRLTSHTMRIDKRTPPRPTPSFLDSSFIPSFQPQNEILQQCRALFNRTGVCYVRYKIVESRKMRIWLLNIVCGSLVLFACNRYELFWCLLLSFYHNIFFN